ncbi:MAG: TIGR03016 family PEP-CTERM system-associated outer membrane protein [Pseudomonadota bacterium]
MRDPKVRSIHSYALAVSILSLGIALPAAGAEWDKGASLSFSGFYSDNVCLEPTDLDGNGAATFSPRVNLTGRGARANLSLRASAEYNSLSGSSIQCNRQGGSNQQPLFRNNQQSWVPRLNFRSQLEAVENLIYWETDAVASQNAINPFAAGGDDNLNNTANTNITYRWGTTLRLDRRINELWGAQASYNYNEQSNTANQTIGDSVEDRIELNIGMIPSASRASVGIRGSFSEVEFEESLVRSSFTNRLARLEARAALNLSRSWRVNAVGGQEDNVFSSNANSIDGSYWDVGLRWSPNTRIDFSAGYGERFFGETPRFQASYRHRRTTLRASYQRTLRFPRNIRVEDEDADLEIPPDVSPDQPGEPLVGDGTPTFIGQSPVLNEQFRLDYIFSARRTSLRLSLSESLQRRVEDSSDSEFRSATLAVSRAMGRRYRASLQLRWNEAQGDNNNLGLDLVSQQREQWRASASLQRRLSPSVSGSVRYEFSDQTSTEATNEFQENRVSLSLNYTF